MNVGPSKVVQRWLYIFFVSVLAVDFAFAQQTPDKKDSTDLYKNIDTFSRRNNFNKSVLGLIFKPVAANAPKKKKIKKKGYKKLIQKPYNTFEGKIIRNIEIVTCDPFGYSIADTNMISQNFIFKTGNKLHVKSQNITIRNLLLIHQNQIFDSLLVKESERLVRSQHYVHDVSFYVHSTSLNSDSVDITIREIDNWSIVPNIGVSTTNISINLKDKNFLGSGHEFKNEFTWYPSTADYAYNTDYFIPNIRNTYVNASLHYGNDENRNFTKSVALDRPFFSPFAKWAAGINITQQFRKDSILNSELILVQQRFKYNTQDFWAGNAIQIFKGNSEYNRTTNFISTIRFLRVSYLEKPTENLDPKHFFSNENFYLAGIGISTRKYFQDKYVFKFGRIEDVPVGKVYGLTGGYQKKNNIGRLYLGARVSFGNYHSWGYLSSNFEYGAFYSASHTQQGVASASVIYFTDLIERGSWKFRQFIKPQVTIGINRFSSDSLTLNDGYGLDGFNSNELSGTGRLMLTLQTQSYTPWNLIGFRFGPFLTCSMGMLGNETTGFKKNKIYSQIGLGVLIKNENTVFNMFQISIVFYPIIPGKGQDIFKLSPYRTSDFGFRDFEIGKPETVVFQ
jgi:hypothetical protein